MNKTLFKIQLRDFIERNNIQFASEFPADEQNIVVVTAVEDFDPKSNDLWDIPANKSYPRDMVCAECKRQVVMSDGMYRMFEEAKVKPAVACGACLFKKILK